MNPREEAPTTPLERSVRINALIADANPEAVAALVEFGAQEALAQEGELNVPTSTYELARSIFATFEPEVPEFEVGEAVAREGVSIGKVESRYLAERDGWEYQVRSREHGTNPYPEAELARPEAA